MSDPTYISSEIDANPEWKEAFGLSEMYNDNAPLGWSKYIGKTEEDCRADLQARINPKSNSAGE